MKIKLVDKLSGTNKPTPHQMNGSPQVKPIENERLCFLVKSQSASGWWRVDLEENRCECEIHHGRKAGISCHHLRAAKEYCAENGIEILEPKKQAKNEWPEGLS